MCVSQELDQKINLKGTIEREKMMRELNPHGENQLLPGI